MPADVRQRGGSALILVADNPYYGIIDDVRLRGRLGVDSGTLPAGLTEVLAAGSAAQGTYIPAQHVRLPATQVLLELQPMGRIAGGVVKEFSASQITFGAGLPMRAELRDDVHARMRIELSSRSVDLSIKDRPIKIVVAEAGSRKV